MSLPMLPSTKHFLTVTLLCIIVTVAQGSNHTRIKRNYDYQLRPSEWCRFALERIHDVPTYMRSLMVYLCSRQAGESKTFKDVGVCMDAVKALCYKECEDSEVDKDYRACVFDPGVQAAYQYAENTFHECVQGDSPCLRLQDDWKTGDGCWQECFQHYSDQCFSGCVPVSNDSPEAMGYLICALKMNPAHQAFRNCLLQRVPSIVEDQNRRGLEEESEVFEGWSP